MFGNLLVWAYWVFTFVSCCLYSSITLSSIGVKQIGLEDLPTDAVKTGAILTSFACIVLSISILILILLYNDKKKFQGYCIGSCFSTSILLLLYAVLINNTSDKIEKWNTHNIRFLFLSSYYLAYIICAQFLSWIYVIHNCIGNERCTCFTRV